MRLTGSRPNPQAHPALAVEPHQLQLLDRIIVGRTGIDLDFPEQHWKLEVAGSRLAHDILAREIAARLFEHLHQGRAASGHAAAPPKSVMTSRRFNRSNCIVSRARAGLQDIDLAEVSQVAFERFCNLSSSGRGGQCLLWVTTGCLWNVHVKSASPQ